MVRMLTIIKIHPSGEIKANPCVPLCHRKSGVDRRVNAHAPAQAPPKTAPASRAAVSHHLTAPCARKENENRHAKTRRVALAPPPPRCDYAAAAAPAPTPATLSHPQAAGLAGGPAGLGGAPRRTGSLARLGHLALHQPRLAGVDGRPGGRLRGRCAAPQGRQQARRAGRGRWQRRSTL